jgi:threonine dehydrogenase-like Zn-dependent dehydrogenase
MKTLVKIAFLSAAALTIAGIAHADHRDYRIALANQDKYGHPVYDETAAKPEEAPQIKEKTYNVSATFVCFFIFRILLCNNIYEWNSYI